MLDIKAINTMFMTLRLRGGMPLHMLDLQKQASLSLTMSDFRSLNIMSILKLEPQALSLPVTPTILGVISKVVWIHSGATKRGIINWNAVSTYIVISCQAVTQMFDYTYFENFVYLTQTSDASLLHRHLSVPVKFKGAPISLHMSRNSLWWFNIFLLWNWHQIMLYPHPRSGVPVRLSYVKTMGGKHMSPGM